MWRGLILLSLLLLSACNNRETSNVTMELIIQNDRYMLDGEKEISASDVANKIIAINPKIIKIFACQDAKAKRILEITNLLDDKITGVIQFDSINEGCS
jgi:hypothetical protein